jgi:2-amino-4-hydroxy-6-hydroxymethyldihydropteridine diphosphokinase
MKKLSKLIIGVGGNLNSYDGLHPIQVGKKAILQMQSFSIKVQKISSWYISEPIPKSDQPDFFNCIVFANTYLNEFDVLENLHLIETTLGRIRININEPRSIDLDLIDFCNKVSKCNRLIIPHPRAHLRRFVMEPLSEIDPLWVHPIHKLNAKQIVSKLKDQKLKIYQEHKIID